MKERERVTEGVSHRAREKEIQNKREKRDGAKTIGTCTTGHTAEKGGWIDSTHREGKETQK